MNDGAQSGGSAAVWSALAAWARGFTWTIEAPPTAGGFPHLLWASVEAWAQAATGAGCVKPGRRCWRKSCSCYF